MQAVNPFAAMEGMPPGEEWGAGVGTEEEPPKKRHRGHRAVARDLAPEALMDHPFFSSQAGATRNKQAIISTSLSSKSTVAAPWSALCTSFPQQQHNPQGCEGGMSHSRYADIALGGRGGVVQASIRKMFFCSKSQSGGNAGTDFMTLSKIQV